MRVVCQGTNPKDGPKGDVGKGRRDARRQAASEANSGLSRQGVSQKRALGTVPQRGRKSLGGGLAYLFTFVTPPLVGGVLYSVPLNRGCRTPGA